MDMGGASGYAVWCSFGIVVTRGGAVKGLFNNF
jgi:hypothetical protein